MSEQQSGGAGTRFVVNLVGAVGLIFGVLPIARYLLGFEVFGFTTAVYDWLRLEGGARYLPPLVVLATCLVVTFLIEKGALRRQ